METNTTTNGQSVTPDDPNPDDFRFRKTRKGEWVVCGPAKHMVANDYVPVRLKSGRVRMQRIQHVGRPFVADGVKVAYGYPFEWAINQPPELRYSEWQREREELRAANLRGS